MGEKYVIAWRSLATGFEGQGTSAGDYADTLQLCEWLNQKYNGVIDHWPKPVESTADLDTQPVIVPDDENGEDTIITRRELDEGR